MATKRKKPFVKFQCQKCKKINYYTHKSKGLMEKKLELKKFCRFCRQHILHKEIKK